MIAVTIGRDERSLPVEVVGYMKKKQMPKKKIPPKKSGGDVEDKKAQEDVYILIKKQTNKKVDANKTKGDFVVVAQIDDGMPSNGPFPQVISFLWVLFGWHKVGEDEKPAMGFLCFLRANRIIIDQLPW